MTSVSVPAAMNQMDAGGAGGPQLSRLPYKEVKIAFHIWKGNFLNYSNHNKSVKIVNCEIVPLTK